MALLEKRAAKVRRIREMVEGADTRELTADERREFDRLDDEVRVLEAEIRPHVVHARDGSGATMPVYVGDQPGSFHPEDNAESRNGASSRSRSAPARRETRAVWPPGAFQDGAVLSSACGDEHDDNGDDDD